MNWALPVATLVGAAALAFVLFPLFRKDAAEAERLAAAASEAQELQSRKDMLLAALKDLEDDRATGKVDDDDYEELKGKLTQQALQVMKRIDDLEEARRRRAAEGSPLRKPRPVR